MGRGGKGEVGQKSDLGQGHWNRTTRTIQRNGEVSGADLMRSWKSSEQNPNSAGPCSCSSTADLHWSGFFHHFISLWMAPVYLLNHPSPSRWYTKGQRSKELVERITWQIHWINSSMLTFSIRSSSLGCWVFQCNWLSDITITVSFLWAVFTLGRISAWARLLPCPFPPSGQLSH